MGSDSSPQVLFEAVRHAAEQFDSSSTLVVIATHSVVAGLRHLSQKPSQGARIEFHPVSDTITMNDDPLQAIRHKRGSSIVVGIRLLKKQRIDAFISAGNTGALLASATLQLSRLPGIKRPALLVVLPTVTGSVAVLDVGGNVSCKAEHLVQFAYMGAAYQSCYEGIESPNVGLLNIGVEPKKGTSSVQMAYQILQEECQQRPSKHKMKFIGNIEGRDVFRGGVDVLVTDGFTGNVLLKTSEGVSAFIFDYIKEALQSTPSEKIHQTFQELQRYFSYSEYPGAIICGVEGVVIKCHGNSCSQAILNGIKGAANLVEKQFITKIKDAMNHE